RIFRERRQRLSASSSRHLISRLAPRRATWPKKTGQPPPPSRWFSCALPFSRYRRLPRAVDRRVAQLREWPRAFAQHQHVELDEQVALAFVVGGNPRARDQRFA